MINSSFFKENQNLVIALRQNLVIAYPTESIFGLGCNPDSERAVKELLKLKRRQWQKGLILIAANYFQIRKYINDDALDNVSRIRLLASWPGPVTWVIPAKENVPYWLTGQYKSIAARISSFEPVRQLCLTFGKAIVSTSANLTGQQPARSANEVRKQFGTIIPILNKAVEGRHNPSEIRDVISGELIRCS